ncbi:hypothetical protein [Hymenobacter rigui]|uniref:STAS/SEC14 domain-containing protein n=1 Tax=Hymenobacter rigui TaxID=334424 RepID=A0A428KFU4_9BACT|nr:hypothetical protein [Hymenobacter rigui]RSK45214.1 hypothetical protein EI291_19065 [Hymenobacter rigui]
MLHLASFPFVTFYLHDIGCNALEAVWGDYVSSSFFREAVQQAISFVRQHQVSGWVADDRRLGPMEREDLAWVGLEVLPALAAAGLRRLAMLESDDWLNRRLIEEEYTFPVESLAIEVRHFTDPRAARRWACGLPEDA